MNRISKPWRFIAVGIVGALSLSACGSTDDSDDKAGSGACATLAYLGPQSGDAANLGINILNGAKLAVDEFNKANSDCQVVLKEYDSQGDKDKAKPLANTIIGDKDIIGVVGPAFSGESDSTGAAFNEAGLVTVSASATNPALTTHGWTTFHRVLGNDATQAPAAAKLLTDTLKAKKVFVVSDDQDYSVGLADGVKQALGSAAVGTEKGKKGQTDWAAIVTKVKSSGADAVYYAGYYTEGGLFAKQLRGAGYTGVFASGDGSLDAGFVKAAGAKGAEGAYLTCPCLLGTGDFATKYKALNGQEPGTYSTEAYDAANIFLQGIKAGKKDRESMLEWVNSYDADGITKHIKFDNGEVSEITVYSYLVKDGKIGPGTPIE